VDIQQAFLGRLNRSRAQLSAGEAVQTIQRDESGIWTVRTSGRDITSERLLLTTGGQSYPGCGTTGDGYRWTTSLGHKIVSPKPALVPLQINLPWVHGLKGVTLPDVEVGVIDPGRLGKQQVIAKNRGSFLFTHFGCSGPSVLNVSGAVSAYPVPSGLQLRC